MPIFVLTDMAITKITVGLDESMNFKKFLTDNGFVFKFLGTEYNGINKYRVHRKDITEEDIEITFTCTGSYENPVLESINY